VLLSMTGYGEARRQDEKWSVAVEVRTVNNRHFKLNTKVSEPYSALEAELERLIRETIRRGTVNLQVRVDRPKRPDDYRINSVALMSYREQLQSLQPPDEPGGRPRRPARAAGPWSRSAGRRPAIRWTTGPSWRRSWPRP